MPTRWCRDVHWFRSKRTIADAFADEDVELYVIGDSVKPRNIYAAIFDGFEIGRSI